MLAGQHDLRIRLSSKATLSPLKRTHTQSTQVLCSESRSGCICLRRSGLGVHRLHGPEIRDQYLTDGSFQQAVVGTSHNVAWYCIFAPGAACLSMIGKHGNHVSLV